MKNLNYRFFYYKTRAGYEGDLMYNKIPDDAIIFIEEEGIIITHGNEFGNRSKLDFAALDKESKDALINAIIDCIINSDNATIITTENIKLIIEALFESKDGADIIEYIVQQINLNVYEGGVGINIDDNHNISFDPSTLTSEQLADLIDPENNEQVDDIKAIIDILLEQTGEESLILKIINRLGNNVTINLTEEQLNYLKDQIRNIVLEEIGNTGIFDPNNLEDLNSLISTLLDSNLIDEIVSRLPGTYINGAGIKINNNVITFDVSSLNETQKNALILALGINEISSGITYVELE